MALLEVRGLTVNYGPIQAVRGIDLDVEEGQIVEIGRASCRERV